MAYVSQTQVASSGPSWSFSTTASAGDLLVGVLTGDSLVAASGSASAARFGLPQGWTAHGLWSTVSTGSPTSVRGWLAVVSMPVTAAGTVAASITWPGTVSGGSHLTVLRYSGRVALAGVAASRFTGRQEYRFPAVSGVQVAPSGDGLRLAIQESAYPNANNYVPTGHTARVTSPPTYAGTSSSRKVTWVASDEPLTSVLPGSPNTMWSGGTDNAASLWFISAYLASALAPRPPLILDPAPGTYDLAAGFTLSWTPDGSQSGVRVTRQSLTSGGSPTGSVEYLTSLSSPAWSTTPTTVTTTATTVTFPAAQFAAAGARYRLTVATVDAPARPTLGESSQTDLESWQGPTASNPNVGGSLVGGVIVNRAPWVTVWGTPGSGASIDLYEVQVVDSTTGEVYAGGTYYPGWWYAVPATEEGAIPNGVSVTLRGRVRQRGVQWSPWVEAGPYPVTVPRPATPTMSVAQITHPVSGAPGLGVTVDSIAGTITLYRDGSLLGEFESSGSIQIQDYLAPSDVEVTYTATVTDGNAPPETSLPASATGELDEAADDLQWLIDAYNPERSVGVILGEVGEITHGTRATAYQPINSPEWIVQALGRVDPRGSLTLRTLTQATTQAALDILTPGRLLMLRRPPERDRECVSVPPGDLWFRVTSDVTESYIAQGPYQYRQLVFDIAHQDPL